MDSGIDEKCLQWQGHHSIYASPCALCHYALHYGYYGELPLLLAVTLCAIRSAIAFIFIEIYIDIAAFDFSIDKFLHFSKDRLSIHDGAISPLEFLSAAVIWASKFTWIEATPYVIISLNHINTFLLLWLWGDLLASYFLYILIIIMHIIILPCTHIN